MEMYLRMRHQPTESILFYCLPACLPVCLSLCLSVAKPDRKGRPES